MVVAIRTVESQAELDGYAQVAERVYPAMSEAALRGEIPLADTIELSTQVDDDTRVVDRLYHRSPEERAAIGLAHRSLVITAMSKKQADEIRAIVEGVKGSA